MHTTLRLALAAATAAALVAPATAAAQACNGTASFAAGKMRVTGEAGFVDGANSVGPNLAFGGRQGAFGTASFDVIQVDQIDSNGMRLGVGGGYQLSLGEVSRGGSRLQLCPVASFGYSSGPDIGPANVSGTDISAGATLGAAVSLSPTVDLVPFGGLSFVRASSRAEFDGGETLSGSDTGGLLNLGTGLAFSQRYTARLSVGLPLSLGNDDTRIGLGFGVNFGGAPSR